MVQVQHIAYRVNNTAMSSLLASEQNNLPQSDRPDWPSTKFQTVFDFHSFFKAWFKSAHIPYVQQIHTLKHDTLCMDCSDMLGYKNTFTKSGTRLLVCIGRRRIYKSNLRNTSWIHHSCHTEWILLPLFFSLFPSLYTSCGKVEQWFMSWRVSRLLSFSQV